MHQLNCIDNEYSRKIIIIILIIALKESQDNGTDP